MQAIQFSRRHFVSGVAAAALLFGASAQAQTALDDILKNKVLKVAIQTDSAP